MPVKLASRTIRIAAPRDFVFQVIIALATGNLAGGEGVRVRSRTSNTVTSEFHSRGGFRTYVTVHKVAFEPPGHVEFTQVEGPLHSDHGEVTLRETGGATELEFKGEFVWRPTPVLGWLVGVVNIRPVYNAVIARYFLDVRTIAESRAGRQPPSP
ncbi:MAG: hypothetical protein FJ317_09800 [SAR202 cluster bacterium]|nr:hypothetical protein [SAR202 cluster bacterium]